MSRLNTLFFTTTLAIVLAVLSSGVGCYILQDLYYDDYCGATAGPAPRGTTVACIVSYDGPIVHHKASTNVDIVGKRDARTPELFAVVFEGKGSWIHFTTRRHKLALAAYDQWPGCFQYAIDDTIVAPQRFCGKSPITIPA